MKIRTTLFWIGFWVVIGLIIWGLAVAINRDANMPDLTIPGTPAPVAETDNVRGPSNAPITLIEYSDFECPACQTYYRFVERLMSESDGSIRMVYRHLPLPQHRHAIPSALASEAAGRQGKFWEMYSLIFERSSEWMSVSDSREIFRGYAEELGLEMSQYDSDLRDPTLRQKIEAQKNEAQSIRVNATPTFFVNGKFIENQRTYEEFKKLIEATASTTIGTR